MKINKTNAARLLDKAKITYELIPYEVDENDLSAVHVAASLGENIEQVFKTLVLHGDKSGYFVCVIPGDVYKRQVLIRLVWKSRTIFLRNWQSLLLILTTWKKCLKIESKSRFLVIMRSCRNRT